MDQEQLLKDLRPWLLKVAWSFSNNSAAVHDLAQEGWIAAWRSLGKTDGSNTLGYVKQAATLRMNEIVRQRPTFGAPNRSRGTGRENSVSTDVIPEIGILEGYVELAYHHNEINAAIEVLPKKQKEYVRLRFWAGLNSRELKAHFGYEPYYIWKSARGKLMDDLSHLKEEKI